MKKALIFKDQIVQIESVSFPVAPELIWIDVADDVSMETHVFDGASAVLKPNPPAPTYQELRRAAYPSIPDQFDLLYHGGMDAWKAAITAVKERFPK